jgi:pimeloyl-ACP methyl ester carboxylesterase
MYFEAAGKQVFATTGGRPFDSSRPVVMFLHGSGLDHTFWGLHARFFAFRGYAVLVPDLPGHSQSEGPPLGNIEDIGHWLGEVVATLSIDRLSIIGHSQGCLEALEFASRFPGPVRSVSFIAGGLTMPVNAALIDSAGKDPDAAIAMMVGWGFGGAGQLHRGRIPGASMLAGGRQVMVRNVPDALATDLRASNAYRNGAAAAAAIRCPTQVILAGRDRMVPPKAGHELAGALKDPDVHVIRDSGHMLPLEAPNRCRHLLRDFVFANNPAP